jgi:ubiquinone/menaquinone biosynthesis C-methylase UbiE
MSQKGGDVYLLDYSKVSLQLVRCYTRNDEVKLIFADALNCPLKDNSFDMVFHQGLLEHFTSLTSLLYEKITWVGL